PKNPWIAHSQQGSPGVYTVLPTNGTFDGFIPASLLSTIPRKRRGGIVFAKGGGRGSEHGRPTAGLQTSVAGADRAGCCARQIRRGDDSDPQSTRRIPGRLSLPEPRRKSHSRARAQRSDFPIGGGRPGTLR